MGFAHSCHARQENTEGNNKELLCVKSKTKDVWSLYVSCKPRVQTVVASWQNFDVGTVSYFKLQHSEFQQLILVPSVLDLSLQTGFCLLQHMDLQTPQNC